MRKPNRIGKYEILEEIGHGGFAVVYKAHDPQLDHAVALKVLRGSHAEHADIVQRFLDEARKTVKLKHRGIVRIFAVEEAEGIPYIAMDYLPGGTLADRLRGKPLPLDIVATVTEQVAAALDHAHKRDLVHRDVKPSNILFDEEGKAVLVDFGLVKSLVDSGLTTEGTSLGTPRYMAPEQAETSGKVDARSDVYALGVVAYEMLTGRVPFEADTPVTVLHAHLHDPPPDPRTFNEALDEKLAEVLLKALAKNPTERYQSAGAFAEALRREIERLQEKQERIAELLTQAKDAMTEKRWDEAINDLEAILKLDSGHQEARRTLERACQARREATRDKRIGWWRPALIALGVVIVASVALWLYLRQPSLTVESHRSGARVDRTEVITGTYRNINLGQDLWLIVQSENGDYWINDHFPLEERQGTWQLEAYFGYVGTRSIGERFKLLLLTVEKGSDAEKVLENAQGRIAELPTERVQLLNPSGLTLVRASPCDCWLADFWPNETRSGEPAATRRITTTYLFQEWWEPPLDGMPETGWTARFVRRVRIPQSGEYCFHRVSDDETDVFIDDEPLDLPQEDEEWMEVGSGCRELEAGEHNVRVDLANLEDKGSTIELWYDGPGITSPAGTTSGVWQALFFPTTDLTDEPIWTTSLPGPSLDFQTKTGGEIPVVNFGAVFSRPFTLTETGYYRFDLDVDDGVRLDICGTEVLDEWHWGPATYAVERHLGAGDHTLKLDYYEHHQDQYLTLSWQKIASPTPPIQRILFASDRDGDYEIYAMDANGANPINLTDNTAQDVDPAWSPDGRQIVFASDRDGPSQLHVMDADGSNARSLGVAGYQPRWSPDGSRIAFMDGEEWAWEIYVMDADGTNVVQLTDNDVADFTPSWSPDGSRILFETGRDGNEEIYVMNADGSDPVNLSQHSAWDGSPAWSPDGTTIAFLSDRDGNNEIYLMDADGSNQGRLTVNDELSDEFPTWSPDGKFLAFEGDNQIYRNDAEGLYPRVLLTDHYAEHDRPHWSPSGYGYTFENLTDGDEVNEGTIAVTSDYIWTGGNGGLMRWNREDPNQQVKFTSEDGLAESNVQALLVENETTLWLGTGGWPFGGSGLSRYDFGEGRDHWRTFTAGDGLGANTIFDLYQDSQGRIWAATTNGLRLYDGARWHGFEETRDNWILSLFETSDGAIWLGTSGAGAVRYDPAASNEAIWQWFDLMEMVDSGNEGYRFVTDIAEGAPGELWLATHAGVVYHGIGEVETWQALTGTLNVWTYSVARDVNGAMWFGTDNGLVRRDASSERVYTGDDGLTGDVHALALDDAGVLWAAGNGLCRYDRENDRWQRYYAHDDQSQNYVSAILEDREGALWLGHSVFVDSPWYGGVSRYVPGEPDDEAWTHFDENDGLSSNGVHTILQDREGTLWFGFDRAGGGVCRHDPDDREWLPCYRADPNGLVTDTVDAIAQTPDGALWFGTSGGGLSRFDGERWETFTQDNSELLSNEVHCLATDEEGALWITTDQGVNRFFYESGEWVPFTTGNSDLIADEVLAMALEGSDGVWFGTKQGLSRYDLAEKKWRAVEGTPALAYWVRNCSQALHVDRFGSVWVGTGEGLYRSTPEGGWVHLTSDNGLASNHILSVFEDAEGTFWIGTPSGLSRVTIKR